MTASTMHDSTPRLSTKQLKPKSPMPENYKMTKTWENKRRLVKKRLMELTCMDDDENEESAIAEMPPLCLPSKESPTNDVNSSSVDVSNSTMERAKEVQAILSPRCPSFIKLMLKSHVSGGFWLGLPKRFCLAHLPDQDETVVLVDEDEKEYTTKYLVDKNGLSGGWRGFSMAHNLLDDDVLVFHQIEPCKFKVYIVRARGHTEIAATSLVNLNSHSDPINEAILVTEGKSELACDEKEDMTGLNYLSEAAACQTEDDSDRSSSEIMDFIRFSDSPLSFKDVKGFKDFHIHFDGLMIDAEIPTHVRKKYHELCCSQNAFLHENIMQGLNSKLVAGVICETTNIADAIRAAKPSTGAHHLQSWDTTLKAFEDLGMVVGFLRARIDKLLSLSNEVQSKIDMKRSERDGAKEEMRCLKLKLLDVEKRIGKLGDEIGALVVKKEEVSSIFKEVAAASW